MPTVRSRKQCPAGKIRNRATGSCVEAGGKIGKRVLREEWETLTGPISEYLLTIEDPGLLTVETVMEHVSKNMDADYVVSANLLRSDINTLLTKRRGELGSEEEVRPKLTVKIPNPNRARPKLTIRVPNPNRARPNPIPRDQDENLDCEDVCNGTSPELINPITKQKIIRGKPKHNELRRICKCESGRQRTSNGPSVKGRGRPKKQIRYEDPQSIVDLIRIHQSGGVGEFINVVIKHNNGQFLPDLIRIYRRAKIAAQRAQLPIMVLKFGPKNDGRHIKVSATGAIAKTLEELSYGEDIEDDEEVSDENIGMVTNICRAKVFRNIPSEPFTPRPHQVRVRELMKRDNTRLLLQHGLGSGKTCSSTIVISDYIERHPDRYVYFFSPGGLRSNFISEYCTKCPFDRRLLPGDTDYERIRFFSLDDGTLKKKLPRSFKNSLVVVDEAQSLIDSIRHGGEEDDDEKNLSILYDMLVREYDLSLLLLSGTPMPNNLGQHYNCLKLLKPDVMRSYTYAAFENMFEGGYDRTERSYDEYKPMEESREIVDEIYSNCISYYVNPPADVASVQTRICNEYLDAMSRLSAEIEATMAIEDLIRIVTLKSLIKKYIKNYGLPYSEAKKKAIRDKTRAKRREVSRRLSNIMHPREDNSADMDKIPSENLDDETLKYVNNDLEKFFKDHSPKLGYMIRNITDIRECPGKQAVYCPFKVSGGVNLISKIMTLAGISHVVYSGDVDMTSRQRILSAYNAPDNDYGEKTKVFMFTDAAAEGISLKSIRGIHLVNENIDVSHTNQVIGRSIRFESHMRLKPEERVVTIFRYRVIVGEEGDDHGSSPDLMVYREGLKKENMLTYLNDKIKTDWNATK